jgi:hypothetical protein
LTITITSFHNRPRHLQITNNQQQAKAASYKRTMHFSGLVAGAATSLVVGLAAADCKHPVASLVPIMAPGYKATLLTRGLYLPSSVTVDPMGNILVLEAGGGLRRVGIARDDYTGASCVAHEEHIIYQPAVSFSIKGRTRLRQQEI